MTAVSRYGSHFVEVDEDGTFSASLPEGAFHLELDVRYADLQRILYVGESGTSTHQPIRWIEIGAREEPKRIDVVLGSLQVRVQAPDEWEGDVVRLLIGASDDVRATVSNGEALLFDPCVPAGEQQVVILNPDYRVYYPGTYDPYAASSILVAPTERTDLDFDLSSPARLHCRIEGGVDLSLRLDSAGILLGTYPLGSDPDVVIPLYHEGSIEARLYDSAVSVDLSLLPEYAGIEVVRGATTDLFVANWDIAVEADLPSWRDRESALLTFHPADGGSPITRSLRYLPEGFVTMVPPGAYRIHIEPMVDCGRVWLSTWYPDAASEDDGAVVDISDDSDSRRLRFDLREAARIEGQVRVTGGQVGVPGGVYVVSDPDGGFDCSTYVGSAGDGRFVVDGLESGTYWCRFLTTWLGETIDLWYPGVTSLEDATPLVLGEGAVLRDIDFWVEQGPYEALLYLSGSRFVEPMRKNATLRSRSRLRCLGELPMNRVQAFTVPLLLIYALATAIWLGCGEESTRAPSDQAKIRVELSPWNEHSVDMTVEAIPYPPHGSGFPYETTTTGGVADLYLVPGDYLIRLENGGYLSPSGEVSLRDESVFHVEAGDARVLEARCATVVLDVRDGAAGLQLGPDEIEGTFLFTTPAAYFVARAYEVDNRLVADNLAIGTYFVRYKPATEDRFIDVQQSYDVTAEPGEEYEFPLIRSGYVEIRWTTPLPEEFDCQYAVEWFSEGEFRRNGVVTGTGDRLVFGGFAAGDGVGGLDSRFEWRSNAGASVVLSSSYLF
ncbi:MAG: hypothetical protein KDA27_27210, partial [Candidatus Eisenbacteria bacterium]|nr:hypothetical protein [Candidatus Eisenbacteria bacterium]